MKSAYNKRKRTGYGTDYENDDIGKIMQNEL